MAKDKYYVTGYAPPAGVSSRDDVTAYQKQLGVKVDGIWGPKTEAAYRKSQSMTSGADLFSGYFNSIMSLMTPPTVSVRAPSEQQIKDNAQSYLRPGVDAAIRRRRESGETNNAELDADAAARGMGTSTYVSSMKEREYDDVEDDVTALEAEYTAALSEQIFSAMQEYARMQLDADMYNANAYQSAAAGAFSAASDWYNAYLAQNSKKSSGRAKKTVVEEAAPVEIEKSNKRLPTYNQCYELLTYLTLQERIDLFYSDEGDWPEARAEYKEALTPVQYERLRVNSTVNKNIVKPYSKAK